MEKKLFGHIDCPTCGTVKGMRVTEDKNREPFGFCEASCGQQLRIGGNPLRVKAFIARHPWAAKADTNIPPVAAGAQGPATVPVPEAAPKPKPAPVKPAAPPAPIPTPTPAPPQKKAGFWDSLQPIIGSK